MAYVGNKRNEFNELYEMIKDNLENIDTIIEPFCGSSAFSYFLSLKHPKKFKYILNDGDTSLIECYKIFQDDDKLNDLITAMDGFCLNIDKEKYNALCKVDHIHNWFLKHKIYCMRHGLYPTKGKINTDFKKLKTVPIINFLKTENIEFSTKDGAEIVEKYKNDSNVLMFLDPPYLLSCNALYENASGNIYEYLYNNNISNYSAKIYLILEDVWIIKLLFKEQIKKIYNKHYEMSRRNTNHIIISN
jgi:site-specific DNA-adenine methylase